MLQSKKTESSQEVANNLHALVAGGGKKKTSVSYAKTPDVMENNMLPHWQEQGIDTMKDSQACMTSSICASLCPTLTPICLHAIPIKDIILDTLSILHVFPVPFISFLSPAQLPTADEVEYWRSPDKAGWLQSQGEVLKSWRKRWFVLKQGHLFRFKDTSVSGEHPDQCSRLSGVLGFRWHVQTFIGPFWTD